VLVGQASACLLFRNDKLKFLNAPCKKADRLKPVLPKNLPSCIILLASTGKYAGDAYEQNSAYRGCGDAVNKAAPKDAEF